MTLEAYERVETAYIEVALSFIEESGGDGLIPRGIENSRNTELTFTPGDRLRGEVLAEAFRAVLRELWWARFEDDAGRYVHFGWDYYMYVGVPCDCPRSERLATERGLFVEPCRSPYHV